MIQHNTSELIMGQYYIIYCDKGEWWGLGVMKFMGIRLKYDRRLMFGDVKWTYINSNNRDGCELVECEWDSSGYQTCGILCNDDTRIFSMSDGELMGVLLEQI